jgi:hypothetical protein
VVAYYQFPDARLKPRGFRLERSATVFVVHEVMPLVIKARNIRQSAVTELEKGSSGAAYKISPLHVYLQAVTLTTRISKTNYTPWHTSYYHEMRASEAEAIYTFVPI